MEDREEKVVLTELGPFDGSQMRDEANWPPRELLTANLCDAPLSILQQGARNALLEKYGYENWNILLSEADQQSGEQRGTKVMNDLIDLLITGKSNQRPLQWTLMNCAPGCQFRLHAHPNIEVVYCIEGALHEIRMEGLPPTKCFEADEAEEGVLIGPSVSQMKRPWKFGTLKRGEWLVNEIGSIHKSFTASNCGCKLLVLWGGSHANIKDEPFLISNAVLSMDQKVCSCRNGEAISETFLPESEKKKTGDKTGVS